MVKNVCKNCNLFVTGSVCPVCKQSNFTQSWKGRITIIDSQKSAIAKNQEIGAKGEYAIKAR